VPDDILPSRQIYQQECQWDGPPLSVELSTQPLPILAGPWAPVPRWLTFFPLVGLIDIEAAVAAAAAAAAAVLVCVGNQHCLASSQAHLPSPARVLNVTPRLVKARAVGLRQITRGGQHPWAQLPFVPPVVGIRVRLH
jgi:hypothetical protein